MKTTFKIAWLELKTLFSSPIAWLLLIIFTIQTSLGYIGFLKAAVVSQGLNTARMGDMPVYAYITEQIFGLSITGGIPGLFNQVISYWYLYIPLLTMGLISRELSSGNIILLFSSPVKVREIVFGKFMGIMLYWTILMGMLLILVLTAYLFITDLDVPMAFSALLGVYLLAMLYSAIGLFVSCLTTYQIVAAIGTFLVLGAIEWFGGLWAGVSFVRDLTYFINTYAHTENFLYGLIVSRDVIYFVVLTLLFLGFAILTLQNMVHYRPPAIKAGRYLTLIILVLFTGYVATRPQLTGYWDVTAFKSNTLTPASQLVLKQIKAPVHITIYDNLFNNLKNIGHPDQVNQNLARWEPFRRFLPGLEIDCINFYDAVEGTYPGYPEVSIDSAAKAAAKEQKVNVADYLPPAQIRKLVNLAPYGNKTMFKITSGKHQIFIRSQPGMWGGSEEYIISNLKRMVNGAETIAFLSGNNEPSIENEGDRDFKYMAYDHVSFISLADNGFEVFSQQPNRPIPRNIAALVIADPAAPYSLETLKHIREYIDAGGNVLIAKGENDPAVLEELTIPMGVRFMPGSIVQPNKQQSANHIKVNAIRNAIQDTTYIQPGWKQVSLSNTSGLQYEQKGNFKISPLLITDSLSSWNKRQVSMLDTGGLDFHPEQGDVRAALPVALALTRNVGQKQQRIVIVGNAGFMTRLGDPFFRQMVFRWFAGGKFPLSKLRKDPVENHVKLSYKQTDILKYWLIGFIPAMLLAFGWIYILKRRSL